ncbi:MAG: prepilin-type N-terminal cleavage/methylation domain-containing protein [Candidatus Omnitrophota bacterium]|jgi:prepilin-type N-terminal cleavage/methylation domain-containing protein
MKKAVTLIELTMAIALMGVVVLGVASFDVGSRRFLQSSERSTQVLNEATLIMDRISKDALTAVGRVNAAAITVAGNTVTINQDTNNDGAVDTVVSYSLAGNQLTRAAGANVEVLTNRATGFAVGNQIGNTVPVVLTLVFDVALPRNTVQERAANNNPQVQVQSNMEVPGWSLS